MVGIIWCQFETEIKMVTVIKMNDYSIPKVLPVSMAYYFQFPNFLFFPNSFQSSAQIPLNILLH